MGMFTVTAACGCFIGNGRGTNQDNFCFNKKHLPVPNKGLKNVLKCNPSTEEPILFAVFDGMGGEKRGEEAALLSATVFSRELKKTEEIALSGKELLYTACEKANACVIAHAKELQLGTMGTTVAALYIYQDEVVSCNVGDSKLFRIRDQQMVQISKDHTDEEILTAMGVNKKPVLLQFIGMNTENMLIDPYITRGDLQAGDVYLACSDGLTDVLTCDEIYAIVSSFDVVEAAQQLLAAVNKANGMDNTTVMVMKVV